MTFTHPIRGTCLPGCPYFGRCHDGCGRRPMLADQNRSGNDRQGRWVKGQPLIWAMGHAPGTREATRTRNREGLGGAWKRRGVYIDRLRPMLDFLFSIYGTWARVGEVCGVTRDTIKNLLWYGKERCSPATAKRIVEATLVHRRSSDPFRWSELDDPPRLPYQYEAVEARRFQMASERAHHRRRSA